ncbi:hypothetical protein [Demequina sp. NBRC 110051]|uniref:hypothetical protein n=1 Tax=Demequina sp. NBRC 110051 TaxID=1570340 RepID=UPI0009FE69CE|nr:hypothetical protein [Demequina sp. NBRC 110051]
MRWEELFADLEAQADADEAGAWRAEVAARERSERASVSWGSRIAAAHGGRIRAVLVDGARLEGEVRDGADDWVLVCDDEGREHVIATAAVDAVWGLPAAGATRGVVERRVSLGHVLRGLARDRARVVVATRSGPRVGRIAWVGADHLELVEPGDAQVTVPWAAILTVRPA